MTKLPQILALWMTGFRQLDVQQNGTVSEPCSQLQFLSKLT